MPESSEDRATDQTGDTVSSGEQRHATRVLLANEPRAYRESLAAVIGQLRPEVEVVTVEPDALDDSIERYSPDVVICSEATQATRDRIEIWVELYPGHGARSVASVRGERTEYAEIQLWDLLSIVDGAED